MELLIGFLLSAWCWILWRGCETFRTRRSEHWALGIGGLGWMTSRYIWRFGALKSEYYRCGGRARAPGVWVRIRFTDGWICRITIPQKFSDVASDEYFLLEILARISSHQENQSIDMIHLLTHTILALMWSTMPKVNLMPSVVLVLVVRTVSSPPYEDVTCVGDVYSEM